MRRPGRRRDRPAAAHPAQDPRLEDVLRDALRDAAKSVEPTGDGLERIRRRLGEPWLARQVSLMLTADWLRLALAAAGAVIIAVAGAVAFGQIRHGDTGISLSTGAAASAHAPAGIDFSGTGDGRFPALDAARATSAHTDSGRPVPSQPLLGGAHSAQVKPSRPAIAAAVPVPDREQSPATSAGCPPSPSGTTTGTPTPTVSPSPTPSPEPVGTPSPALSSSLGPVSGTRASTPRTPAVGRQSQPCDDGRGRQ